MSDPQLGPFEPRLVRQRKRRARATFRDAAFLHERVAADLADRLEAIPRPFPRVLALGGGGLFSEEVRARPELSARIGSILETDLDFIDPEHLPFAPGSFELIVSPLALHWINDLPGALIQLRHALKPDGLLLASLFGGETLHELRAALAEAEIETRGGLSPRVAPMGEIRDLGGLLQRAGLAMPVADSRRFDVTYPSPLNLMLDLRAMGETNVMLDRDRRPLRRETLARACAAYAHRFGTADGRVRATFEVIFLTGWAPAADQPKPLRPGSARVRLADAIGDASSCAGSGGPA